MHGSRLLFGLMALTAVAAIGVDSPATTTGKSPIPITQIHPTAMPTTKVPMTTTTTTTIVNDAPTMNDDPVKTTIEATTTTMAPMTTTTTTALPTTTTVNATRWNRNPRSNTTLAPITTTALPETTTVATTTMAPTTEIVTEVPKPKLTTLTTILTTTVEPTKPTTIDKMTTTTKDSVRRYRRSPTEEIVKTKSLLPTKIPVVLNETTVWMAEGKLDGDDDDEWKNATFERERRRGNDSDWEADREDITIAIIEKFERTTLIHHEGPVANETRPAATTTTAAPLIVTTDKKEDDDFVDIEKKEKDDDSDDSDDDDDIEPAQGAGETVKT